MPEHQQLSILRQVTAEHQDGQAEHSAREQVDDLERHPGKLTSTTSRLLAKAQVSNSTEYSSGTGMHLPGSGGCGCGQPAVPPAAA